MAVLELDDWLNDDSGGGSGGGKRAYLSKWKDAGTIDVVLHPQGKIATMWVHSWWREWTKRGEESKVVPWRFVSHETDAVVRRRYFRDADGELESPPEHCPFAKTIEWVRQAIDAGKIGWCDPIFEIEGADRGRSLIIHAGGFCGMFGDRRITDEQKSEMREHKINLKDAWRENCGPRLQYVFRVVQYDKPDLGVQIATEAQSLGDRVKKVIKDRRDDLGVDRGNPFRNPVVIRWTYDDKRVKFDEKYDAKAMSSLPIDGDVAAALEGPAPEIESIIAPGDAEKLRLSFEANWIHKVVPPWDDLFADALKPAKRDDDREESEQLDQPTSGAKPDTSFDPAKLEADDAIACDVCDGDMKSTEFTCPHCGTEYDKAGKILKRGTVRRKRGGGK
jgi:predicted RNA-binding Zn-ribbon protein involved in translation (DUF1610 family)